MDKERKKKLQTWRLILTESFMFIAVVIMVIILIFVAMGYKLGSDGSLNQTGLVQVDSIPTGALVTIDGEEMFSRTNMNKMLSEDEHKITLTKDGYEMWEKTITVRAGILYQLDYPRLFKQDREAETIKKFDKRLKLLSASSNRSGLLYMEPEATTWKFVTIRGDEPVTTEIDVAPYFRLNAEEIADAEPKFTGEILNMTWSGDGNKVLIEWRDGEVHDFTLLNVRDPKKSVNLTEVFGLNFSDIKLASDSADRLLALENENLHKISVSNKELSEVLVSGVESFSNLDMDVIYISRDGSEYTVGLYREGVDNVVKITTLLGAEQVRTVITEYLDQKYIGIVKDNELVVYRGEYPTLEQDLATTMTEVVKRELDFDPDNFYVHDGGRFIVAKNDAKLAVFNAELTEVDQYEVENGRICWLDEFLVANIADGKLVVRDFDGTNRRTLANASTGYDAVISVNNKWLYYVAEHGTQLKRERL